MVLWSILRLLVLAAASALAAFVVVRVAEWTVRRLTARRPWNGASPLVRGCRRPFLCAATAGLMLAGEASAGLPATLRDAVRHGLVLLCVAACAWLAARLVALLIDTGVRLSVRRQDAGRIRRARTQAGMLRRVCQAVIAVVAFAAMLMTFPAVRTLGASLLASAGLIGVVAGVAAQSTLGNLVAGIQMSFGDMVRIGDEVVVAGEWGTVEEITLTYVVVATWDQRRIVMPVSYFAGRPFENWSRNDARITGTAVLHLDHRTPMDDLRVEFDALLAKSELWDGEGSALQVVDTTPSTIVVRALMTARNAGDAFDLRCHVRERLVGYLREHHPQALPRLTVADAGRRPEGPPPG
ncbi:mechanosensitive ion channel family protein [Kitasatospora sp. NPDC101801]|uniref:mechanosensitive ion channel family protein n=1 Tax=Kitasatospora sp. NPDC101801 TaxID=3364103 RepID=UPI00382D1553